MLALDTETRGLEWSPGVKSVFMVQAATKDREYVWRESDGWDELHALLAQHHEIVMANASFDLHHLRASGIVDLMDSGHRVVDVQTLARVAIIGRFGYRLEDLGSDLLGVDATEAQRALKEAAKGHEVPWTLANKDYEALDRLEPELMARYGAEDVRLTLDLWNLIWRRCSPQTREIFEFEQRVAQELRWAERRGIRVDTDAVARLRAHNEAERDRLRELLLVYLPELALGWDAELEDDGSEITPRQAASRKALLHGLLKAGVKLYKVSPKSGELTTRKDALEEFSHVPVVGNLIAWRQAVRILTTYVPPMEGRDRIHTSFRQVEARTSRMSSAKPALQNLPRVEKGEMDASGVRACLVPAKGNAFVVCDFDSIEVRVLAYYLNDPILDADLDAGVDFHSRTAAHVYGGSVDMYEKGGDHDYERTEAKTTTFTVLYGGGSPLLSARLHKPVEECARLKSAITGSIPNFWDLWDGMGVAARKRGFMKTILGRKLASPKDKPHVALNTAVQGTAAELMKLGMLAAAEALKPLGYHIVLVVHDEVVAEGPAHLADEAQCAMIHALENCYPLRPRLKATGSWSEDSYAAAK